MIAYEGLLLASDEKQLRDVLNTIEDIRKNGGVLLKKIDQDTLETNDPNLSTIMSDMLLIKNDFIDSSNKIISAITAGDREAAVSTARVGLRSSGQASDRIFSKAKK
ncbi:hypothetical protein [Pectobacterium wasabiae]|uniref:Uncharacterized protein n=1 Tax=Pectobacterium wasabiae TaxID=55208 RepID=A0AAW3EJD4_9GAMM|nr:hypothetical protein [Pectobacterium wasabiae]AOR63300.1 hypothetical protein A7983_08515 [Pectobacterium wasabiae CFBP 3304]EJS96121.1 Hypothetical protein Y17_0480 [Pectobacterium wasabiae CFBP 3304]KFX04200.1 hypothetical protein JV38_16930 [Pectobacterium wasabiae]KGA27334.1 hypothetical protein KU73_16920 [Pectobacterium wasabiae]